MIATQTNTGIQTFSSLPRKWQKDGKIVFLSGKEKNIADYGFYPVIEPELAGTQKKGEIYFDPENKVFTYQVIEKTATELALESANWLYPLYSKRIVASELLLLDETGARFFKLFEVRGLLWKNNNGVLNIYCNEIEEAYLSILASFGESVTIEDKPE